MMTQEKVFDLEMLEDYCCGGGHCGPLPGYTFICPSCKKDSICRTGIPLKKDQNFKCLSCKEQFLVLEINNEKDFKVQQLKDA